MEFLNNMNDVYKSIEEYSPGKKRKLLLVFDDTIANMVSNQNLHRVVTELFLRDRKLNISFVFIAQSHFLVPKHVRLNTIHFFIMKILSR